MRVVAADKTFLKPSSVSRQFSFSASQSIPVVESIVLIDTKTPCSYGKCSFCNWPTLIERQTSSVLSSEEFLSQSKEGLSGFSALLKPVRNLPRKLSLMSGSHSLLAPDVVKSEALLALIEFAKKQKISELSFDTRMDTLFVPEVHILVQKMAELCAAYGIKLEFMCGIETPYEKERIEVMNKGLTDEQILKATRFMFSNGIALRSYYILFPITREGTIDESKELKKLNDMLAFLNEFKLHAGDSTQIFILLSEDYPRDGRTHREVLDTAIKTIESASQTARDYWSSFYVSFGVPAMDYLDINLMLLDKNSKGWTY